MPNLTSWLPGGVLTLGCIFTLAVDRQHATPLALPLDSIPATLAGRVGESFPLDSAQIQVVGVTNYLYRRFPSDTAPFEIYVGYYEQQTQGKTIHSPKNCLPGSGWEALNQSVVTLQTAAGPQTVNRYLLQNKEQRALVFYWYQGRGRVEANEYRVKWQLLRDSALRGRSEEALMRVIVFLNPATSEARAAETASRAASELIPEAFRVFPVW
jgi:EpsI family protein